MANACIVVMYPLLYTFKYFKNFDSYEYFLASKMSIFLRNTKFVSLGVRDKVINKYKCNYDWF
jgi:hypothetical protein